MNLHDIPKEQIFTITTDMKRAICLLYTYGWQSFILRVKPSINHTPDLSQLDVYDGSWLRDVGISTWVRTNTGISNFDSLDVRIEYE